MGIKFKFENEKSDSATLQISGNATVKHCKELQETLLTLGKRKIKEISLVGIESLDITGLQLLYLLKEEYKAAQKPLTFIAPKNEEITDIINRSGLFTILESYS